MKSSQSTAGYFEPELVHTFLPGCRNCGGSHPLARKPQLPADVCPDCEAPTEAPGPSYTERAVISGGNASGLAAKTLLAIGKALNNFSKRI